MRVVITTVSVALLAIGISWSPNASHALGESEVRKSFTTFSQVTTSGYGAILGNLKGKGYLIGDQSKVYLLVAKTRSKELTRYRWFDQTWLSDYGFHVGKFGGSAEKYAKALAQKFGPTFLSVSPDGSRVALLDPISYFSHRDDFVTGKISVADPMGKKVIKTSAVGGEYLYWSPDGRYLAGPAYESCFFVDTATGKTVTFAGIDDVYFSPRWTMAIGVDVSDSGHIRFRPIDLKGGVGKPIYSTPPGTIVPSHTIFADVAWQYDDANYPFYLLWEDWKLALQDLPGDKSITRSLKVVGPGTMQTSESDRPRAFWERERDESQSTPYGDLIIDDYKLALKDKNGVVRRLGGELGITFTRGIYDEEADLIVAVGEDRNVYLLF